MSYSKKGILTIDPDSVTCDCTLKGNQRVRLALKCWIPIYLGAIVSVDMAILDQRVACLVAPSDGV